jgi:hypothetical protein
MDEGVLGLESYFITKDTIFSKHDFLTLDRLISFIYRKMVVNGF